MSLRDVSHHNPRPWGRRPETLQRLGLEGEGRATQPGTKEASSHCSPLGSPRNQANNSDSSVSQSRGVRDTGHHILSPGHLTDRGPGLLIPLPQPPPAAISVRCERSLLVLPPPNTFQSALGYLERCPHGPRSPRSSQLHPGFVPAPACPPTSCPPSTYPALLFMSFIISQMTQLDTPKNLPHPKLISCS